MDGQMVLYACRTCICFQYALSVKAVDVGKPNMCNIWHVKWWMLVAAAGKEQKNGVSVAGIVIRVVKTTHLL